MAEAAGLARLSIFAANAVFLEAFGVPALAEQLPVPALHQLVNRPRVALQTLLHVFLLQVRMLLVVLAAQAPALIRAVVIGAKTDAVQFDAHRILAMARLGL